MKVSHLQPDFKEGFGWLTGCGQRAKDGTDSIRAPSLAISNMSEPGWALADATDYECVRFLR